MYAARYLISRRNGSPFHLSQPPDFDSNKKRPLALPRRTVRARATLKCVLVAAAAFALPSISWAIVPLQDVQTRIETSGDGKRIYLKVYDPSREQWMEESFYDDDIWGSQTRDGVVAWKAKQFDGLRWYYCARYGVYDPGTRTWKVSQDWHDNTVSSVVTADGVVASTGRRDDGGSAAFAAYDPETGSWQDYYPVGGASSTPQIRAVEDGVAVWSCYDSWAGGYAVGFGIYDPRAGSWKHHWFHWGESSPTVTIANATVTLSQGGHSETWGYDPDALDWYEGQTQPLAYFSPSTVHGNPPLGVWFWEQSIAARGWDWHFDDTQSATEPSPYHVFDETGLFVVTLTTSGPEGSDVATAFVNTGNLPEISVFLGETEILNGQMEPIDFNFTWQGQPQPELTFTVRNDAPASYLGLGEIRVPEGFELVAGFSTDRLAEGESDTFTVRLNNDSLGEKTGDIAVVNGDLAQTPFTFPVKGYVGPADPAIVVFFGGIEVVHGSPTPIDVGTVEQGSGSLDAAFEVCNYGFQDLTLDISDISGDFPLIEGLDLVLGNGGSDTFTVRMETDTAGVKTGAISIVNNDPHRNPFIINLTGLVRGAPLIVRVSPNGDDGNDGSSWAAALRTVQAAIDAAEQQDRGEVWVQAGTYYPTSDHGLSSLGERGKHFRLKNDVGIYGGFAGTETERGQRDWANNVTILSGDLGVPGDSMDNAYHVFYHPMGTDLDATAVLDGFTITGGNANRTSSLYTHQQGGGVYLYSSPTLVNCSIMGNNASSSGGGLKILYCSPTLVNCTIRGNSARDGGGLSMQGNTPALLNCTITGNTASRDGGGFHCTQLASSPTLANCTITGNSASRHGSGLYMHASSPMLGNTVVAFNSSGIYRTSSSVGTPVLRYNCVYGNTQYDYSGLDDPTGTDGNIDADPLFIRGPSDGGDGWGDDPGTPDVDEGANDDFGDLRLMPGSPCIDAGDNEAVPADVFDLDGDGDTVEPIPFGLDGYPRFVDDPATSDTGNGTPPITDMGVYEFRVLTLVADAGPDRTIAPAGSTTLQGSATGGTPPYSYEWTPAIGLSDPSVAEPTASPSSTTTYTLTVTDAAANPDTSSDTVIVTVLDDDDADGDGVPDTRDNCPDTPAGQDVNADGCSCSQLDDDGDGVDNCNDQCPGTAAGDPVDTSGCSTDDDDGDGMLNDDDLCPDTPTCATSVDADGCAIDSDGDGNVDGCGPEEQGQACCGATGPVAPLGLALGLLVLARVGPRQRRNR